MLGTHDALQSALLHNKLGWLEVGRDDYVAAADAFEAGLARLSNHLQARRPGRCWLESQVGLAQVHYWQDEPDKLADLSTVLGPAFKAKGEPRHRQADYLGALLLWQLAERRHRVDNEVLDTARKGLAAARNSPTPPASAGTFRR